MSCYVDARQNVSTQASTDMSVQVLTPDDMY